VGFELRLWLRCCQLSQLSPCSGTDVGWVLGPGAAGAAGCEGGVPPPCEGARTPVATSGVSPGECSWGRPRRWVQSRTWWQPRALPGARGSHRGPPAPPQRPQQQLHQEEQVDAPQHRQPLQHCGPRLGRRLLVSALGLDGGDTVAQGTPTPRCPPAPHPAAVPGGGGPGAGVPTWGQRCSSASPQSVPTARATRKASSERKELRLSSGTRTTARAEGRLTQVTASSPQPSAAGGG